MNNFKNNTFWFWGFIILIILNVSAVSTMLVVSYKMHNTSRFDGMQYRMIHKKSMNSKTNCKDVRYWKDMDLTPEQQQFVLSSRKEHRQMMHNLKLELNDNQAKLLEEIAKKELNSIAIEQNKELVLETHHKIMDETIRYYESLKTQLI